MVVILSQILYYISIAGSPPSQFFVTAMWGKFNRFCKLSVQFFFFSFLSLFFFSLFFFVVVVVLFYFILFYFILFYFILFYFILFYFISFFFNLGCSFNALALLFHGSQVAPGHTNKNITIHYYKNNLVLRPCLSCEITVKPFFYIYPLRWY